MARAVEFRVTPSLTIAERYDDNVLFSRSKIDDFATDATPKVLVIARGEDLDLTANLGVTRTQYAKNPELSFFSTQGGLVLKADTLTGRFLRGLGLTVTDNYVYTKDHPTFAGFATPDDPASGGIQTGRFTSFSNNAGVTVPYVISARAQVSGSYTNSYTTFSSNSGLFNTTGHALTGGWSYLIEPQTTFLSNYTYSKFSFSGGSGGSGGSSIDTHAASVGIRRQFLKDLIVDANMGGTYVPSSDRLSPSFNIGATQKFSATDVGLRLVRSVSSSGGLAAQVSEREILSAFITHRVTKAMTATLTGNYATATTQGTRTVDITTYSISPGLTYDFTKWARLTASYSYYNQRSEGAVGSGLLRNQVTVGLTITWP